jgi:hypothetical protein
MQTTTFVSTAIQHLYKKPEAARMLRVSVRSLEKVMKAGKLPVYSAQQASHPDQAGGLGGIYREPRCGP